MSKRKRFIVTSLLLSLGFIGIQLIEDRYRFFSIGGLTLATVALFYWSLREGLKLNSTLLSIVLPTLYTLGVGLFWFLLPSSILARIPTVILYGIGIYSLCLTSNIYTVSAIRTIALSRAARGVGFILTLVTSFLLFDAVFSLRTSMALSFALVVIVSILIYLQGLWMIKLEEKLSLNVVLMTLIFSLVMGEVSVSLFFWPVTVVVGSLFLTGVEYVLLGLGQAKLEGRLFSQTVREYFLIGLMVFIGMFFATHWGA